MEEIPRPHGRIALEDVVFGPPRTGLGNVVSVGDPADGMVDGSRPDSSGAACEGGKARDRPEVSHTADGDGGKGGREGPEDLVVCAFESIDRGHAQRVVPSDAHDGEVPTGDDRLVHLFSLHVEDLRTADRKGHQIDVVAVGESDRGPPRPAGIERLDAGAGDGACLLYTSDAADDLTRVDL